MVAECSPCCAVMKILKPGKAKFLVGAMVISQTAVKTMPDHRFLLWLLYFLAASLAVLGYVGGSV